MRPMWFVCELTLAVLKAGVPDGEQEAAIKAGPYSLTWHVPAPHPASISLNRVSFLEKKDKKQAQTKACIRSTV